MTQVNVEINQEIAISLLELLPRLFQKLRPNLTPPENADDDNNWQDVTELRATVGQFRLLRVVESGESCKMQDIAEQLGVTPSTVTTMIKRLVAQGYVERTRDDVDWRSVWISLTERGRRALRAYDQARLDSLQTRLAQLDLHERETILAALPALRHLIELNLD